ncbi:MAG: hypothetical protein FJW40_08750 [Acidobacteria bacterium]|nr:hypothetical protein [Acidobacteriota bacterium]
MACYISTNANRFYLADEPAFGTVPAITAQNRVPALRLEARQELARSVRRDKTGSRTFAGLPANMRRSTQYALSSYMTSWGNTAQPPLHGPLFKSALGSDALMFTGGTVAAGTTATQIVFSVNHGLGVGQGIRFGGEIRFVTAIVSPVAVIVNAPFTITPSLGSPIGATASYAPRTELPSMSIFDYWSPATAVQRIVRGAGVDRLRIRVNGDFHEFEASGPAADLLDTASFQAGAGALTAFPPEPAISGFDYNIIPGHLGQVWIGTGPDRFHTLTDAEVIIDNNMSTRELEFGADSARCLAPGERSVQLRFSLFEMDDDATRALYQAARTRSPIPVMIQLGQTQGQLFGVFMSSMIPEVPEFSDRETRLVWNFSESRAQGVADDEIFVAFA